MRTYITSEIARIMGIHPNTVMLYEKWGYIAPASRKENGYRVYGEDGIKLLKIIKALRQENYSTQCICRMLKKLKTKVGGNDMLLFEETVAACIISLCIGTAIGMGINQGGFLQQQRAEMGSLELKTLIL